jgi:hypothetical protein
MPRGRPKGSRNLNAYERGKVKRIRETLTQKGITNFNNLRDTQIRHNIYRDTDGGIFVNYEIYRNSGTASSSKKNLVGEKSSTNWKRILKP